MDNKKRNFNSLLGILRYILHYRFLVSVVLVTAVAGNVLALQIPRLTGNMVDALTLWESNLFQTLLQGAFYIALVASAVWLISVVQNIAMLRTAQQMVKRLRRDVFAKLMKLNVAYFDTRSKGDIISVVGVDIDNVSDTVSSDAVTLISGAVTVVGALAMMLALSHYLTLIFVVTVPLMAVSARFISKRARVLHRDRKNCFGRLCGYAEEMITAQKSVRAYGIEEYNINKFKNLSGELREKGIKAEFIPSCMMPVMNGINNLNFTLICVFGALLVLNGGLSIGGITAFVLYSRRFAHPIIDTANIINMFQTSLAACDRVFAVLNAEEEKDEARDNVINEIHQGAIRLDTVKFSYLPDVPVLEGIDIDIKPGQCIAVVGATGSGKTTLTSLLLRFYLLKSGRILLDGKDINEIPLNKLRRSFALVLQDSWLFEGTVYENIGYAAPFALTKQGLDEYHSAIRRMCEEIQVDAFIHSLPNGYETILHNDSGGLSQGQKQLINIARAFLCDPAVFILDEATSSVDTVIESQIRRVTERVTRDKTSIIIAHRLSTVLRADNILVLKNGVICESGTHKALIKKSGVYRDLYESQFN